MIANDFFDYLTDARPPTQLVEWIHNAISSSRLFVSSPNIISTQIHWLVQLRIWDPLTRVTYGIGDSESPEVLIEEVLHSRMDMRATCPGNWATWSVHLIIWYSESCVFAYRFEVGTPAIGEAVGLGVPIDDLIKIGMDRIRAYEVFIDTRVYVQSTLYRCYTYKC